MPGNVVNLSRPSSMLYLVHLPQIIPTALLSALPALVDYYPLSTATPSPFPCSVLGWLSMHMITPGHGKRPYVVLQGF